jgi:hypothetical protein
LTAAEPSTGKRTQSKSSFIAKTDERERLEGDYFLSRTETVFALK